VTKPTKRAAEDRLIAAERARRRPVTADERAGIEFAIKVVRDRLRGDEAPPQYVLDALLRLDAEERDRRDRLGVRAMVINANETGGLPLTAPGRSRKPTAFDKVASDLGREVEWVYDAYRYPSGRKKR
jgi:hypothetical protein